MSDKRPTFFEVTQYMSEQNDPALQAAPLENISNARYSAKKRGTTITIGFGGNVIGPIARGSLLGGLFLIDRDAYAKAEAELIAARSAAGRER